MTEFYLVLYNFSSRLASLVRLAVDITRSRTRFKSLREMEENFEVLVFILLKKGHQKFDVYECQ